MKKLITLLTVMILLPMTASGEAVEIDGIYYNLVSKVQTAEVTRSPLIGYEGKYSGSISIPSSVEYQGRKYTVTSIGSNAFYECYGLEAISMPESLLSIGFSAFSDCFSLKSVTIPNSVTTIDSNAFEGCI